jgi:predicted DNA-binding transcriptional regulator YafY
VAGSSPLVRQWILLRSLSARHGGATIQELVAELGVCEKTIRRDLAVFTSAGFPIEETIERFGRKKWRLDPLKTQPGLTFAFDEAAALYLGRRFLDPLAGTPFWDAAQRAHKKIRATLGKEAARYLERFAGMFHQTSVGTHDYARKSDVIDNLMLGIEDRRALFITYQSLRATEPVTYDAYPYGLVYHRGSLYLVGFAPQHGEIRHWKVDRMEAAELTELKFPKPPDFDLATHLSSSFGIYHGDGEIPIKIRFTSAVARYVTESAWHPSQQLHPQPDGSLLATFCLGSTEEIKRWILSFGPEAEVLEPERLRQEIADEARQILQNYEAQQPTRQQIPVQQSSRRPR